MEEILEKQYNQAVLEALLGMTRKMDIVICRELGLITDDQMTQTILMMEKQRLSKTV